MAERIQKQKPAPQERKEEAKVEPKVDEADLSATDDLLDEIDSILEEQEVLINYRQKGGQ